MNILTGFVFVILALSFVCVRGSEADSKRADVYASVCAVSLVCIIVLVGYWLAVLLGKL